MFPSKLLNIRTMENSEKFFEECVDTAINFGLIQNTNGRKKQNVVIRKNLVNVDGNVQYFGFINPIEAPSGPYSDFSLVFLPTGKEDIYVMSIGVGSEGFRNDYDLANTPGMRRLFINLLPADETHHPFCKPKFVDIESPVDFSAIEEETNSNLDKYRTVLSIGCLINATNEDDIALVKAWIAQYAEIRKWASTAKQRENIQKAINVVRGIHTTINNEKEVIKLLSNRRFVVPQGAPGTGKTYLAEKIGSTYYSKVFFTQFHAETTFSDFVYGIFPKLESKNIEYEAKYGELCEAIQYANENKQKKVLLIIDEINRANLANVLGPVFYLFEPKRPFSNNSIRIGNRVISEVPKNLYVLATMNTADRNIAVVDFALRRRFAWYTLKPQYFSESKNFIPEGKKLFEEIASIFEKYASDSELNLQPGGAYFMAESVDELNQKIEYELMPLIKEYLEEGLIASSVGEFNDLFYRKIKKNLFQ